jgi:ketosteroid isomerase-like protein
MTRLLKLASCLSGALLLMTSCAPQAAPDNRAADEKALRDLDTEWSKAAQANNVDATVGFYADDAYLLPPNAPIAHDKAGIRANWAALLTPGSKVSWEITKVEVAKSGEIGYVMGTYQVSMKDDHGQPVNDHGKLVEIWKKQADGTWKCAVDIFNSDLPLAPPEKK